MVRRVKNYIHAYQAKLANLLYRFPSKKIQAIGVTGTDGKTTTASLIHHILKTSDAKSAMITTVGAEIDDRRYETGLHTTTPSSFVLQKYIKKAVDAGCEYLVLEVTSHALDQNRIKGINFKIGVVTNVTHEHLDYHKSYQNYLKTKSSLLKLSDIAVLNADDESYKDLRKECKGKIIKSYSLKKNTDYNIKNIDVKMPEQFEFNYQNFMAAMSVASILNVEKNAMELAIATFKFPEGRQEIVYDEKFRVIIDFAHTPNSFKNVLPAIKKTTKNRLIHVFGAAGERDRSKRPLMGQISSKWADVIVLTAEDPRKEDLEDINTEIKRGIMPKFLSFDPELYTKDASKNIYFEIKDRRKAIEFAIKMALPGDTVVITGKGHEKSINLGHGELPWSEHKTVGAALRKIS